MNQKTQPEPGKVVIVTEIPDCNFCADGTPGPYDFATRMGPWANGCEAHWSQHRASPDLGVGKAQLWILEPEAEADDGETPAEELGRLRRELSELGTETPEHRDTLDRIAVLTRRQAEGHDIATAAGRARSETRQDARAIEVKTSGYEFAHGRKPRGTGTWAFQLGDDDRPAHTYWHNGSYAEGKRRAQRIAKWRGLDHIEVLP